MDRLQNAQGVAKRTRVYDTKKLAKKFIATAQFSQNNDSNFNTLSVEQMSAMSSNNMWKVNKQQKIPPKSTKAKSISHNFFAIPQDKFVLRRKDFAVDEQNK